MKTALYVANPTAQIVAVGGAVDLGSVIRRVGCGADLNGNDIIIGSGFFTVDASIALLGTATGTTTVTLYKDGMPVQGATASASLVTDDLETVSINAIVRNGCIPSNLTFVVSGTGATVNNSAVVVERV